MTITNEMVREFNKLWYTKGSKTALIEWVKKYGTHD